MAAERYTRTNQKIYFAGLALETLKKAEAGELANAQAHAQASREAALFHLYGALLGLCQEIAGYYRLGDEHLNDAFVWLDNKAQTLEPTPERAELLELKQTPESWLWQLLHAYAELLEPVQEQKKAKVDPRLAVIEVVNVDAVAPLAAEQIEQWRQALKQQVLRFRETLSEC